MEDEVAGASDRASTVTCIEFVFCVGSFILVLTSVCLPQYTSMIFAFNCALIESMLSLYQGQIMADLKADQL
jgi:hypothetical protein